MSTTKLICGDTLQVMDTLNHSVDLVFLDPPNNLGVRYDADPTRDKMSDADYRDLVWGAMYQAINAVKPSGTIWLLCLAHDGAWVWDHAVRNCLRLLWGKPIIFHERFCQNQQTRMPTDYRFLFPFCLRPDLVVFHPDEIRVQSVRQEMGDKRADPRGKVPGHVWRVRRLQGNAKDRVPWHPAQLAPEPLTTIVKGWTSPGDTVLDAFSGSAGLGVVCKKLGRNYIGIDRSENYVMLGRKRLAGVRPEKG
jgi:DNA modification methylase